MPSQPAKRARRGANDRGAALPRASNRTRLALCLAAALPAAGLLAPVPGTHAAEALAVGATLHPSREPADRRAPSPRAAFADLPALRASGDDLPLLASRVSTIAHPAPAIIALPSALAVVGAYDAATMSAATHVVSNCNDTGSGSLRQAIAESADGDIVDMTGLTCSTISIGSGLHTAGNLTLQGPGATALTIERNNVGGANRRVIYHTAATATDTLTINDLTIADGVYAGTATPVGGCIKSEGNVVLHDSVVRDCRVFVYLGPNDATPQLIAGGGIYAHGSIRAWDSVISGNHAVCQGAIDFNYNVARACPKVSGGGLYA